MSENYRDELYHHGILGMKWGIRRFQNKDGSLTPSGKKRYGLTKREVKKSIKQAKRAEKKRTGVRGVTGKHVSAIDKKVESEYNKNKDVVASKKRQAVSDKNWDRYSDAWMDLSRRAGKTKEELDLLNNSVVSIGSDDLIKKLEKKYSAQKKAVDVMMDKAADEAGKSQKEQALQNKKHSEIRKKYISKYEDAVVRDIGYDDIELGKEMLNEYGLMDYALGDRRK